jgi:ABC-type glycerol-3-phosphate transport system substrate-binding protein
MQAVLAALAAASVDMAVPGTERTVLAVRGGKSAALAEAVRAFKQQHPDARVVVVDDHGEVVPDAPRPKPSLVKWITKGEYGPVDVLMTHAQSERTLALLQDASAVRFREVPRYRRNWLKGELIARRRGLC